VAEEGAEQLAQTAMGHEVKTSPGKGKKKGADRKKSWKKVQTEA